MTERKSGQIKVEGVCRGRIRRREIVPLGKAGGHLWAEPWKMVMWWWTSGVDKREPGRGQSKGDAMSSWRSKEKTEAGSFWKHSSVSNSAWPPPSQSVGLVWPERLYSRIFNLTFGSGSFSAVGGCPVHCRVYSSIPSLYPLDVSAPSLPPIWQPQKSPDLPKCPLGAKSPRLRTTDL